MRTDTEIFMLAEWWDVIIRCKGVPGPPLILSYQSTYLLYSGFYLTARTVSIPTVLSWPVHRKCWSVQKPKLQERVRPSKFFTVRPWPVIEKELISYSTMCCDSALFGVGCWKFWSWINKEMEQEWLLGMRDCWVHWWTPRKGLYIHLKTLN